MIEFELERIKPMTLLDVGCGNGEYTKNISQYCGQVTAGYRGVKS